MPGANYGIITGTAAMAAAVQIPAGQRPYMISVQTGAGATATLKIGTFDPITIPESTGFGMSGDAFPDAYIGPIQVDIQGTPIAWMIAYGDVNSSQNGGGYGSDFGCGP